jgi:hypothetical protein
MKPLFLMTEYSGDIRPSKATTEEIRKVLDGERSGTVLAHASFDAEGNLIATALEDAEIATLRTELHQHQIDELREVLDATLALVKNARSRHIAGFIWSGEPVVWPAEAPHVEDAVRQWAGERGLHVHDEGLPTKPTKSWIRCSYVRLTASAFSECVVRMQWPAVDTGTTATAVEVALHGLAETFGEDDGKPEPIVIRDDERAVF